MEAIDLLEKKFDLVMISAFMQESLILLKHALCWSTENVVALRHNARNSSARNDTNLSSQAIVKLMKLNEIDMR